MVAEDVQSVVDNDNVFHDVKKERHLQQQQSASLSSIYSEGISIKTHFLKYINQQTIELDY